MTIALIIPIFPSRMWVMMGQQAGFNEALFALRMGQFRLDSNGVRKKRAIQIVRLVDSAIFYCTDDAATNFFRTNNPSHTAMVWR